MKSKKGQVTLYIYFFITASIIIVLAALLAPIGVLFNTKMFQAGEVIIGDSLDEIDGIQDLTVKASVNATVASAKAAATNNITVNSAMFQYAWVVVLVLTAIIVFLYSRRLIEVGAGGFI